MLWIPTSAKRRQRWGTPQGVEAKRTQGLSTRRASLLRDSPEMTVHGEAFRLRNADPSASQSEAS